MSVDREISPEVKVTKNNRRPSRMVILLVGFALLIWWTSFGGDLLRLTGIAHAEPDGLADWLAGTTEVMAGVLAVGITVVAIVVELASNRYSHRISDLFFDDNRNQLFLLWLALTTLLCLLVSLTVTAIGAGDWFRHIGLPILLGMIVLSIGLLIPYFFHVFSFLRPASIVRRIEAQAVPEKIWHSSRSVDEAQQRLAGVLGDLGDVAGSAIKNQDRDIVVRSLESLFGILDRYQTNNTSKPAAWGELSDALLRDPDFAAMSASSIENIRRNGVWLETKVIRQALLHLNRALPHLPEVAHVLASRLSRLLGVAQRQPHLFPLVTRGFNSALRIAINRKDQRTGYYLFAHYRQAAEQALDGSRSDWAMEISGHLAFYGQLAFEAELPFLLEVAAHDQVELIRSCDDSETIDALLEVLLEMDRPMSRTARAEGVSLLGVRRAQIRAATHFLAGGQVSCYSRVCADLATERTGILERLIDQLDQETRSEYWEFTDRGMNFGYLPEDLRGQLSRLRTDLLA